MRKIYTKTGDNGETSLLGGKRVSKDCITLEVTGEIDELNSTIGEAVAYIVPNNNGRDALIGRLSSGEKTPYQGVSTAGIESLVRFLQFIQRDLFKVGAEIAFLQSEVKSRFQIITEEQVKALEKMIDGYSEELPELKQFILPGGTKVGSHLHHARTVSRRVERSLVAFAKQNKVRSELFMYFNRLSDFLFIAARWINWKEGVKEVKVEKM